MLGYFGNEMVNNLSACGTAEPCASNPRTRFALVRGQVRSVEENNVKLCFFTYRCEEVTLHKSHLTTRIVEFCVLFCTVYCIRVHVYCNHLARFFGGYYA